MDCILGNVFWLEKFLLFNFSMKILLCSKNWTTLDSPRNLRQRFFSTIVELKNKVSYHYSIMYQRKYEKFFLNITSIIYFYLFLVIIPSIIIRFRCSWSHFTPPFNLITRAMNYGKNWRGYECNCTEVWWKISHLKIETINFFAMPNQWRSM